MPPAPAPPLLLPAAPTTGLASANAIAGIGATVASARTFPDALLAHLGTMAFDPTGSATAEAALRVFARLGDGSEREFWRARVAFGRGPSGEAALAVDDPLGLLTADQFTPFTLRDGRAGSRLTAAGGIDLRVPLDPAVLADALPGPVELRFETRATAASNVDPLRPQERKRLIDGVSKVTRSLARHELPEVAAWLRAAGRIVRASGDVSNVGVAAHLLRQARAAAADNTRFDVARRITQVLRGLTGVGVDLPDLPGVRALDVGETSSLTPVRFEIVGEDRYDATSSRVEVEVNGRMADSVVFDLQPSIPDGASLGRLAWAFGTRRPEDVGCSACPTDLGLSSGQNQIVVTVLDSKSGAVIGAAEALVLLTRSGSGGAPPRAGATGGPSRSRERSAAPRGRRQRPQASSSKTTQRRRGAKQG